METPTPGDCPLCGYHIELASGVTDPTAVPKPGDYTMCIKCGGILRFDPQLKPVRLTIEDVNEINADPRITHQLARLTQAHRFVMQQRTRRN